jgi:hypothetical protein
MCVYTDESERTKGRKINRPELSLPFPPVIILRDMKEIPGSYHFTRSELFDLVHTKLAEISMRALGLGYSSDEIVAICVDVEDPFYYDVVGELSDDVQWEKNPPKPGDKPLISGVVTIEYLNFLRESVPGADEALDRNPPTGCIRTLIMGDSGISLYYIHPQTELRVN